MALRPCTGRHRRPRNSSEKSGRSPLRASGPICIEFGSRSDSTAGLLEDHPKTSPGGPNNPAAFLGDAEHQFESIGQPGIRIYLKACPASGIINNMAIDNRSFGANDEFGLRTRDFHYDANKPSLIDNWSLSMT